MDELTIANPVRMTPTLQRVLLAGGRAGGRGKARIRKTGLPRGESDRMEQRGKGERRVKRRIYPLRGVSGHSEGFIYRK